MPSSLQITSPSFAFDSPRILGLKILRHRHFLCSSSSSPIEPPDDGIHEDPNCTRKRIDSNVILRERNVNGTYKRYTMDNNSYLRTFLDKQNFESKVPRRFHLFGVELSWLPDSIKVFFLPAGFPGSVSDDYLEYMFLQFPTNITGWICHALVTSSLLKAVGVGSFSGTTAAAASAAIMWVSKDGIGAIGRLIIGGRFGDLFDDDPKQWRMYADFIGSAGSIFDLTTQLYPTYFFPLASLGNLTKAVARGLKDPSFRVIQSHFAISGNLGEVAAKEEVWEVSAQLLGLSLGVWILATPGLSSSYPILTFTWFGMRLLHLWLRYQSLSVLKFDNINLKRARVLVSSHILDDTVPGCSDCNKSESILSWQRFLKPRIDFGVSVEDMLDGEGKSVSMVKKLVELYTKEKYILVVKKSQNSEFQAFVSFKVGATGESVLRSVWQAYWLYHKTEIESYSIEIEKLEKSLLALEDGFRDFIVQLESAGWDIKKINLKIPKGFLIEELDESESDTCK
ncbi:protein root UVB sensitive 5 [Impatiens glandulifera]|uniref:protein root UVB sensitive 5 n=1 Tax=Impatiens glandulifera TaxID=253017 RepID=UPI001FB11A27|nr:protein root UVB sensitive 5 [Impatiens glandulifera]